MVNKISDGHETFFSRPRRDRDRDRDIFFETETSSFRDRDRDIFFETETRPRLQTVFSRPRIDFCETAPKSVFYFFSFYVNCVIACKL